MATNWWHDICLLMFLQIRSSMAIACDLIEQRLPKQASKSFQKVLEGI